MTTKQETRLQTVLTSAHLNYAKKLNAYACFRLSDCSLGEDLVQNTFMKTWIYLVKGGKIKTMRALLYHILNDLIIDEYRKHKTYSSLNFLIEKGFEPSTNNSEQFFNFLDGKASVFLIDRLPEAYKNIIYMRYVQELSIEEMATLTGQSKNSVKVRAHRGLKKLKLLYKCSLSHSCEKV